jgi:hypothetical protein
MNRQFALRQPARIGSVSQLRITTEAGNGCKKKFQGNPFRDAAGGRDRHIAGARR